MKAIVYDAPRKFEYRDVDIPKIQPNEILLRVHACGVCGTDLHVHEGEFGPRFPLTPGHEFSGEIVELPVADPSCAADLLHPEVCQSCRTIREIRVGKHGTNASETGRLAPDRPGQCEIAIECSPKNLQAHATTSLHGDDT